MTAIYASHGCQKKNPPCQNSGPIGEIPGQNRVKPGVFTLRGKTKRVYAPEPDAFSGWDLEEAEPPSKAQAVAEKLLDELNYAAEEKGLPALDIESVSPLLKKKRTSGKSKGKKCRTPTAKTRLLSSLRAEKKRLQGNIRTSKRKLRCVERDIRSLSGRKRRKTIISD